MTYVYSTYAERLTVDVKTGKASGVSHLAPARQRRGPSAGRPDRERSRFHIALFRDGVLLRHAIIPPDAALPEWASN